MVIESLSEWNHWWKDKKVDAEMLGKRRILIDSMSEYEGFREIKLFAGIRRSGKSTLFYQTIDSLLKKGVSPEEILLVNFEDDVLSKKSLIEIFNAYQSNVNMDKKPYIFLDEIHRCGEWALFLRKLYDLKKVRQVFITDSSSKFIPHEYASLLTGRSIAVNVFPLSFAEYIAWKGLSYGKLADREGINRLKKSLLLYLEWGGFPEVFFKMPPAKKKLLTEYFSDIISKDIVERYNVSYQKIKPMADFLVSNSASVFSPRKYSRAYGLSLESVDTYMQYFKEVFLFYFVPKFSYSIKSQQLSPKKIYTSDMGLFSNVGIRFSENIGRAYENAVFIEMERRGKEVYYWKNKFECDFIIKKGLKPKEAIQVCYKLTNENREREINGLVEAMEEFGLPKGTIITEDYEEEEKINGKRVAYIPLWKWLLEKK